MTSTALSPTPCVRCFKVIRRFGRRPMFRRARPHVAELVTYGIAVAARKAGVSLHEYGVGADRVGLVLSASEAGLAVFMEKLDEVVAEGAEGTSSFWRRGLAYEATPLEDGEAVIEAMADIVVGLTPSSGRLGPSPRACG